MKNNYDIVIIGGNLDCPEFNDYTCIDLFEDPIYLKLNAQITAHCAVKLALNQLPITLNTCEVLVIGWGRIGKCLSSLLKNMGADVTVGARKASDRAMIRALGFGAEDFPINEDILRSARVIYNTVPYAIVDSGQAGDGIKIDLASKQGILGDDVVIARGLPGIHFPESSGRLIAQTLMGITRKEGSS